FWRYNVHLPRPFSWLSKSVAVHRSGPGCRVRVLLSLGNTEHQVSTGVTAGQERGSRRDRWQLPRRTQIWRDIGFDLLKLLGGEREFTPPLEKLARAIPRDG